MIRSGIHSLLTLCCLVLAAPTHAQSGASLALQLDGVDDYAEAAHRPELNAYPLTVTAWVKTSQNVPAPRGIVTKYVDGSGNGYGIHLENGRVRAWYYRDINNRVQSTDSLGLDGGFIADNQWHHVAFAVDSDGGRLYVDGSLRVSRVWVGTPGACTTTTPLHVGRYDLPAGGFNLTGQIDEVSLWNSALTSSEIAWMRGRNLDGREPTLRRYYRFNHHGGWFLNSAGSVFVDDVTSGSPQTVESTAPVNALGSGLARSLDSARGYRVQVPHSSDLNAYPLALTCWLRTTQNDSVFRGIMTKYVDGSGNGYSMHLLTGRVRAFYYRDINNWIQADNFNGLDGGFVSDGNWHHLAFVVTQFGGQLYVDGVSRANVPWTGTAGATTTTATLQFGRYGSDTLSGTLDEVTVWNRDLRGLPFGTNSLAGTEAGLIGYWRLDEHNGAQTDSSPQSHTPNLSTGVQEISTVPIDPPFPFTLPAAAIGPTGANLAGVILPQPHGRPFEAWFEWGLTTNYGNQTPTYSGSGTGNVSRTNTLAGLGSVTTYHYRLVTQKDGRRTYGADHLFTTLLSPPVVTTMAATNVGGTNATFVGQVDPNGATTKDIWFEWGITTNLGNQTLVVTFPGPNITQWNQPVNGLAPGTTYYFRVVGRTTGGQVAGAIRSFATVPPPIVTTAVPGYVSGTGATLVGQIDPRGATSAVGWFEWGTTTNLGNSTPAQAISLSLNRTNWLQSVSPLSNTTTYYFRAVGRTSGGQAVGVIRSFTTLPPPPVITMQPQSVTVLEDSTTTFIVAATGAPPLRYEWSGRAALFFNRTNATLTVSNVQLSWSGDRYYCLVTGPGGTTSSSNAVLTVLPLPRITQQPLNVTLRGSMDSADYGTATNGPATFTVAATSSSPIRYQWRFNGEPIAGATNASLVMSNVNLSHEGMYDVTVTDDVGTRFSRPAQLRVLMGPIITVRPVNQIIAAGSDFTMSVEVTAHRLPIAYTWRRGGIVIATNSGNYRSNFVTLNSTAAGLILTNNITSSNYFMRLVVYNEDNLSPGVTATFTNTVVADFDQDGIPDVVENELGLNPNDAADAALDGDGDGMSNGDEYKVGTDPANNQSYLRIDLDFDAGTVSVAAVSNRTYSVQFTDAFESGIWQGLGNILAVPTNRVISLVDPGWSSNRFYRVLSPAQQ